MKKIRSVITLALSLFMLFSCCAASAYTGDTVKVRLKAEFLYDTAREMLPMVNGLRTGNDAWILAEDSQTKEYVSGLDTLAYDYELEQVAMQRALEIAAYFGHIRPDGSAWSAVYPGSSRARGENLAYGYGSAESAFKALSEEDRDYAGQGHRRNMLRKEFTRVGFGAVRVGRVTYWVQAFGSGTAGSGSVPALYSANTVNASTGLLATSCLDISTDVSTITVEIGDSVSLPETVIVSNSGARLYASDCSWKMKDKKIAGIRKKEIIGISEGTTTLEATVAGRKIRISVTVTDKDSDGSDIEYIDEYDTALAAGDHIIIPEEDECFELEPES